MISLMFFRRVYTCQTKAKECCNRKWWCLLTPPGSIIYPSGPTSDSPWRYLWIVHQFSVIVSIVYSLISYAMVTYVLFLWSPLVSIHFGCYQLLQGRIACTICQPKTERIQMATFRRLTFKFWRSSELPWRWRRKSRDCSTEIGYIRCSRLRECCRQVEAEVVSNNRNKIHQTWSIDFSQSLYKLLPELHILVQLNKNCWRSPPNVSLWQGNCCIH